MPPANGRVLQKLLLAILPAALLVASCYLADARGPYSLSQNFDPAYGYLLSSVSILNFEIPTFTDNPGTTVEEIGAAASLARWSVERVTGSKEAIAHAVLARPEEYLWTIRWTLALLVCSALFWAGWNFFSLTGSLAAGIAAQMSVFFFRETIIATANVSPEPLLVATTLALGTVLLPRVLPTITGGAASADTEFQIAGWAGVLWGFGVVTKFTFIPAFAVILIFATYRARVRFLLSGILSGLLFAMPIWRIIYRPGLWLYGVLIHKGYYGQGERGILSISQAFANFRMLLQSEPGFFALNALYLVALGVAALRPRPEAKSGHQRRMILAAGFWIVLQFAAAMKQYRAHYIIPAYTLMAIVNGCLAVTIFHKSRGLRRGFALATGGFVVAAFSFFTGVEHAYRWSQLGIVQKTDAAEIAQVAASKRGCRVVGFYRSSAPGFGMSWGSEYAEGKNAASMLQVLPDTIVFNRFQHRFLTAAPELRTEEVRRMLADGACILMQGTTVGEDPLVLPPGFSMTPVVERTNEGLYLLALSPASK